MKNTKIIEIMKSIDTQIVTIIESLNNGNQFKNEISDWYTLSNIRENRRIIVIRGEYYFYKNINSYAKRIKQLINKGY